MYGRAAPGAMALAVMPYSASSFAADMVRLGCRPGRAVVDLPDGCPARPAAEVDVDDAVEHDLQRLAARGPQHVGGVADPGASRSVTAIFHPHFANSSPSPLPRPLVAPVIRTRLFG